MKTKLLLLFTACAFWGNGWSCNGFTPAVTSNTYIGNGQYQLTIDYCEFVSNGAGSTVNGILVNVNGANILSVVTPSLYGISQNQTIFPTTIGTTQVEYGDWGNSFAPLFLDDGDPQECWQILLIVDNAAATVDVYGSSSNDAIAPGTGMIWYNGAWTCNSTVAVPPAVCDASWIPPVLCAGETSTIDLNTTTAATGVFTGTGVNSGTGVFNPTGLTGTITINFAIGDAFFNCNQDEDIVFQTVASPTLTDTTICVGDAAPLDAEVTPPPPPVSPCTYSISLEDTYGDGWNGGSVTVLVDGNAVLTNVTLASGYGPANFDFDVMPGETISVTYSGGSFTYENYYTVNDGAGGTGSPLYASGFGFTPPASQAVTNPCTGGGGGGGGGCAYELLLSDSYGDGFGGATVDIYINGVLYAAGQTVLTCGGFGNGPCDNLISIPVSDADVLTFYYTSGSFNSENTVTLYDNSGSQVSSGNNLPTGWLGGGVVAVCPATSMDYSWSPALGLSDANVAAPSATPGTTTLYTVTVTDPNTLCTSQTNVSITVNNCALPVDLVNFDGRCLGNDVVLDWETMTESNNDYFMVEYSQDAMSFNSLGKVDGLGSSLEASEYNFRVTSQEDFIGYYRLKQFDVDGSVKTSNIISVECQDSEVSAYVVNGAIIVSSHSDIRNIRVLDMGGKTVCQGASSTIDISTNSSAMYFLEVETENSIERLKVVGVGL